MKTCIRRSSGEDHPTVSIVSIISQFLELIGDDKVKKLQIVLQYVDEILPGWLPQLQQWLQLTELVLARAGAGHHSQGPDFEPPGTEIESTRLSKQTIAIPGA
ncbi:hypothetical protein TorRG33x02_304570 [Trema orientale]|uniref:Uncharacterized protein n=1 Tax=Trema orientale TaxID=63057 RepID=A0A2P5BXZ3_TREOI|nr:hypothetical protein TorRG33x02_304570 [Trema orientale]